MVYTLLSVLLTTLLLTFVISYMALRVAVAERPLRRFLFFFVLLTPVAALVALFKAVFGRPKPLRYVEEYGLIEDAIERERIELFGGKPIHPSFSHRWQKAYFLAIEKSAAAAAKRFGPAVGPAFCGITHRQ
jgi:ABC-type sugar transport system permease subunit